MASNPLTAGLGKIALGLALFGLTGLFWLISGRILLWLGAIGFVILLWGIAGGGEDNGYNQ